MVRQRCINRLGALIAVVVIACFLWNILASPFISEAAKYFSLTMVIFVVFAIYVQIQMRKR
jgi:hypothetical protein